MLVKLNSAIPDLPNAGKYPGVLVVASPNKSSLFLARLKSTNFPVLQGRIMGDYQFDK